MRSFFLGALYFVWTGALAVMLLLQLEQSERIATLEGHYVQLVEDMRSQAGETQSLIQQNSAVMHRAIGTVIPMVLPEGVEKRLEAMEARLRTPADWPSDEAQVNESFKELQKLVKDLPPWVEEDLLPRLNALRWGVAGVALLVESRSVSDDALEDFLDRVETTLDAKPEGAAEEVKAPLAGLIQDHPFASRIAQIRDQARDEEIGQFVEQVNQSLERAHNERSQMVRQMLYTQLLSNIVAQHQAMQEQIADPTSKSLQDLANLPGLVESAIKADQRAQDLDHEESLRKYQTWALQQVREFNSKYDQSLGTRLPRGMRDTNKYVAIKTAMVTHLLPISPSLLDTAVLRLYNRAFDQGWTKLEAREDLRMEVAKQEAVVPKRSPGE